MKTVLTNCTVIDCCGSPPVTDSMVVIKHDRIVEIRRGLYSEGPDEDKARVINLEGGYVLPGLWNTHTHLGDVFPDPKHLVDNESVIDWAIRAGRNCVDALRHGVTGIRVVGEEAFADVAWKRAFDIGVFVGPRLFTCGPAIYVTAGGGHNIAAGGVEANGPYEIRKVVREQLKRGVDQIKLVVSGGHADLADGTSMDVEHFLPDEIEAAVEAAHQKGKRVCAHSGGQGTKTAIRAGVDSIEHAYFLDDEAVEMMVENDVFYVPTLVCNLDLEWLRESGLLDMAPGDRSRALEGRVMVAEAEAVDREYAEVHLEGFQKALKAGVKMVPGGDSNPVGEFSLLEIEHMVRAGMGEMEVLIAATRTSADLCGVAGKLGTVEVGKLADLIVLSANPLEDISNIRRLKLVLKDGKVIDTECPEGQVDFWELLLF